jgi:hypothetical protein
MCGSAGTRGVQLRLLGPPSTYTSAGSGQFVSAASYFGVLLARGFDSVMIPPKRTPRPGLSRFQMEARFSAIPDTFNCNPVGAGA